MKQTKLFLLKTNLLMLILLSSCGSKHQVQVSPVNGQVNVVHQLDIAGAIKQIGDACKTQYPEDLQLQSLCFQTMTERFMGLLQPPTGGPI